MPRSSVDRPAEPAAAAHSGSISPGAGGASLLRRLYWRSRLRAWYGVGHRHRGLTPSDVFTASHPRSGVLWLRFMLVELLLGDASLAAVVRAAPLVGLHADSVALLPAGGRLIKTHELFLPAYRRAIHLVRDPRDIVVSYFGFLRRSGYIRPRPGDDPAASFDAFVDAFLAARIDPFGSWLAHLTSWLDAAEQDRADVLLVRYEDLRADTPRGLLRIVDWLGVTADAEAIARAAELSNLDRMRAAEAVELARDPRSPFRGREALPLVTTGTVGGWREALDASQKARFAVFAAGLARLGYEEP